MKNKILEYLTMTAFCAGIFIAGMCGGVLYQMSYSKPTVITEIKEIEKIERVEIPTEKIVTLEVIKPVPRMIETDLSDYEKELIARVVTSEACYEDEIGKRLVVDTILNRVADDSFPNSVHGVIYQDGQFYMANFIGAGCMEAVEKEVYERLDYDILWFAADSYLPYGIKAYQHGGHYFSWRKDER